MLLFLYGPAHRSICGEVFASVPDLSHLETADEGISADIALNKALDSELTKDFHETSIFHLSDPTSLLTDADVLAKLRKRTAVVRIFARCPRSELAKHQSDWTAEHLLDYYDRLSVWHRINPPDMTFTCTEELSRFVRESLSSSSTLKSLHVFVRPIWQVYFIRLAKFVATRSNCSKRRVGAVLVKDKRIIATGYNGTPSAGINCLEGGCDRCRRIEAGQGVDLDICECIHAEVNALLEVGRSPGASMYVTLMPCINCAKLIVQVGVRHLYYLSPYDNQKSLTLLKKHNVIVEQVLDPALI